MLSLRELRRAARGLQERLAGHRVQAVLQPDADRLVLSTYGPAGPDQEKRHHVLFSCRSGCARVSLLERPPAKAPRPLAFDQYLRAHVSGARIDGARIVDDDRQLALRLRADEGDFDLLLALLGRRSNLVLLDAGGRVLAALRPLAETRPELALGEPWRKPESRAPEEGDDRFAAAEEGAYLEVIEAAYAEREGEEDTEALRRRIGQALRKEGKRLDGKLSKLEAELATAREAPRLERQGELLKGVLARVQRGDASVVAQDWETGEEIAIALDPTLSPAENLARIFKRYQKAVRALTKAGAQEHEVRAARDELTALAEGFRRAEAAPEALAAFCERDDVRALLRRYAPAPAAPAARRADAPRKLGKLRVPGRLMPRRYRSSGGMEIWVGRSDAGNDHLSTRLARGKDLFFHLDGAPGSHVVLRTEGRSDPPAEAVLDACELAVHFSKFKKASRADVHVVPIKNVKKPKGAKPGLVMVHGGKTVHLRRTPARLERLLSARIEDEE